MKQPDLCPSADGELPPLWVSCGEPFIDPAKEAALKAKRQECNMLRKHLRALCDMLGGNPADTRGQLVLHQQLQEGREKLASLQSSLDSLLGHAATAEQPLPKTARQVRIRARRNGACAGPWRVCWGSSLGELLTSASEQLGIAARRLYSSKGLPVVSIDDLRVDAKVYVSSGEPFVDNSEIRAKLKARIESTRALRASQADNAHVA
jgi:hypothetical protein